ncbi:hypothetical protein GCM10007377_04830 [Galliscardovia ingluviei]|uniref:Uncharacterized protein n=1 Tax=Galliscardovia ingluviei TaxID=1769422 RepID=A0A8J3AF38_9BIFI|nr:hypothetical protein GCM10007377_04830 [Galliscardovia ingluviei]
MPDFLNPTPGWSNLMPILITLSRVLTLPQPASEHRHAIAQIAARHLPIMLCVRKVIEILTITQHHVD